MLRHEVTWLLALVHLFIPGLLAVTSYSPATCNISPYGEPDSYDCHLLAQAFADGQDDRLRVFDEEQLRGDDYGNWPGIRNPFQTGAVQIPRLWSRSMSLWIIFGLEFRKEGSLTLYEKKTATSP